METTRCKFGLILLVLAVLQDCPRAADHVRAQGDVHSLQFILNITFNEQSRCMVQALMDTVDELLYDCDNNEVMAVNDKLKGTETLADMKHTLKDMGDLMRRKVSVIEMEKYGKRVSRTLQVRLECRSDARGSSSGSWEFCVDGQRCPAFHPGSREYKADNSRGEELKEKLENDEDIKKFLRKTSGGDCKTWLQLLVPGKKEGETAAAPATDPAPATPPAVLATPATTAGTARSKAMTTRPVTSVIPVILTCLIILGCVLLQ